MRRQLRSSHCTALVKLFFRSKFAQQERWHSTEHLLSSRKSRVVKVPRREHPTSRGLDPSVLPGALDFAYMSLPHSVDARLGSTSNVRLNYLVGCQIDGTFDSAFPCLNFSHVDQNHAWFSRINHVSEEPHDTVTSFSEIEGLPRTSLRGWIMTHTAMHVLCCLSTSDTLSAVCCPRDLDYRGSRHFEKHLLVIWSILMFAVEMLSSNRFCDQPVRESPCVPVHTLMKSPVSAPLLPPLPQESAKQ